MRGQAQAYTTPLSNKKTDMNTDLTFSEAFANARGHFKTIPEHRNLVMRYCFRCGLYRQGLLHDLSKYTPSEFYAGVLYYQGDRSPNDIDRRKNGFSAAWMHHKGRNKHHYEYWNDYILPEFGGHGVGPVAMPRRYVAEMFCDRLAACHIYNKGHYSDDMALNYFTRAKDRTDMHPDTKRDLEFLLRYSARYGEEKALQYIRKIYLKSGIPAEKESNEEK